MNTNDKRLYGIVGTLLFHGVILLLLILLSFKPSPPPYPDPEGILINFGNETEGLGNEEPMPQETSSPKEATAENEQLTQDFQDAPSLEETKKEKKRKNEKPQQTEEKTKPEKKEKTETINQNALFPSNYNPKTGQGEKTGPGNKGNPNGDVNGTGDEDLGRGTRGITYNLNGRKAVKLAAPKYPSKNREGKVVLAIRVDNSGNVIAASVAKGTTTFDPDLIKAAKVAALKTKFNKVSDPLEQVGTITFVFKLR